jgi:hypothetical protein
LLISAFLSSSEGRVGISNQRAKRKEMEEPVEVRGWALGIGGKVFCGSSSVLLQCVIFLSSTDKMEPNNLLLFSLVMLKTAECLQYWTF